MDIWKETNHLLSPPKCSQDGSLVLQTVLYLFFLLPFCELSRLVSGFLENFIRKFAKGILLRQLSLYPWRPSVMFPIYSSSRHKNVEPNYYLCVLKHYSITTTFLHLEQYKIYHILGPLVLLYF